MSGHREPVGEVPETRIKYKDVFSLKNLYIMMHELLMEEGWVGLGTGGNVKGYEMHADIETLYSENVYQKGVHSGGKEMWVWWRTHKIGIGEFSGYFEKRMDIDWHLSYGQDVEAIHQGKKVKVQSGELEMFFRGEILGDKDGTWGRHPVLKHFQDIYEKRIMSQDIDKMEKDLWRDIYRISSKMKAFLNMRTFLPISKEFHPMLYGAEGEF
ncbi:hypothetical protein J4212_08330 [Candidatus Woesearchaeota archaeon]|nr:hypothetical protein [Candidatus Woesearchaeota archaeon]